MRIVDEPPSGGERAVHPRLSLIGRHEDVEVGPASRRGVTGDRVEGELRPTAQRIDRIGVAERLIAQ